MLSLKSPKNTKSWFFVMILKILLILKISNSNLLPSVTYFYSYIPHPHSSKIVYNESIYTVLCGEAMTACRSSFFFLQKINFDKKCMFWQHKKTKNWVWFKFSTCQCPLMLQMELYVLITISAKSKSFISSLDSLMVSHFSKFFVTSIS